jgi:endogenous inhibitor of DNA gyrase (YacG/DUF329 family)
VDIKQAKVKLIEILDRTFSENLEEGRKRNMSIKIAIEALEKQIPKKPYLDKSDERTLCKCPNCKYIFVTKFADGSLCGGRMSKYCPECGQKLDWED